MMLVDAVTRLLPGALGHEQSAAEDSFSRLDEAGRSLLDCPHYTRPREWRGREVPEVLLGGDHAAIERWRHGRMVERTRERRPDLMERPLGGIPRPMSQPVDGGLAQDAQG
jgi:tRNA (guanine37-N1)-methyltransferase